MHHLKFKIPSSELATKAGEKVKHHKERLTHWNKEMDKAREAYVKSISESAEKATKSEADAAVQFAEALALDNANYFAGAQSALQARSAPTARQREIMGDPEVYQTFQHTVAKVQEHKGKVDSYERWEALFKRDPEDKTRKLTFNDAEFFGL